MTGVIIGNRYELIEKIGSGGMAIVYKARCRLLNRFVAVKMLRPEFNDDVEFLKRFETEAQAAASLSHPNIVSVHDVGTHDKIHYIVMEYVEGVTLKEFLTDNGPLPIEKIVDFSTQIAKALEHAHAKKIIHHDIKPHNIIITESGLLKVTDFGLARAASASTTIASTGAIGSVHYASPEQARGGFTDEKSDIYSLGITMYEMTTGHVPFDGDTPVSVAIKHLQKQPTPPSELAPDVPQSLEHIILKAIEKDPSKRYQNATELIGELRCVLKSDDVVRQNEGDEEKFSTRRMPSAEEIRREEARAIREVKPREQRKKPQPQPQPKPEPKPEPENLPEAEEYDEGVDAPRHGKKKEDTVAVVAAIATTVAIVAVLALVLFNIFGSGTLTRGSLTAPDLVGMTLEDATALADEQGFKVGTQGYAYSADVEEGKIISQTPEKDKKIKKNDEIMVTISRGTEKSTLSNYVGWEAEKVKTDLGNLKIKYTVQETNDNEIQKGYVIRTNPAAGAEIKANTTVTIVVSLGKADEKIAVPELSGNTVDGARRLLESKKLRIGNVSNRDSQEPKGTIIQQSPVSGSSIIEGASVDVVVSNGTTTTTPSVTPSQATPHPTAHTEPSAQPQQTQKPATQQQSAALE